MIIRAIQLMFSILNIKLLDRLTEQERNNNFEVKLSIFSTHRNDNELTLIKIKKSTKTSQGWTLVNLLRSTHVHTELIMYIRGRVQNFDSNRKKK